jgi:hypothetical protein
MSITDLASGFFKLVSDVALGADYFFRQALGLAPLSKPKEEVPFVPPFEGGQCADDTYNVTFRVTFVSSGASSFYSGTVSGPVQNVVKERSPSGTFLILVKGGNNTSFGTAAFGGASVADEPNIQADITSIQSATGRSVTECGSIGSPIPPDPTSENGLADGGDPNFGNEEILVNGLVPTGFAAALAAALAALAAANDILEAIRTIGDALKALADALDDEDDEDEDAIELSSLDIGTVRRDGFLRLYPSDNTAKLEALFVDFQIKNIPKGYGRFFGKDSPNRFEFRRLGHIAFVSGTFGVINVTNLEFPRTSLTVPLGAIGFFYHFGLDGIIESSVTAFYQKKIKKVPVP